MPRDEARDAALDPRTMTPDWYARETRLAHMLPYVSLVDDQTVRTRVNELFRCIRLEGINSYTTDDAYLDKVTALFARIIAQLGPEFSYYVHKVSKAITPDLEPVREDSFAGEVDRLWRTKLETSGLRDKTLTLTVIHRPPPKSLMPFLSRSAPDRLKEETRKRLQRLGEAVNVFLSGLTELKPRLLSAASGELVGFLGALNTGTELPLYPANTYGFLSFNVANTRVTFHGDHFELSEGVVGHRYGKSFTIGEYSEATSCTMFDMLNLPVDMIVTHSFTPINSNLMAGRIKRQKRQMQASQDTASDLGINPEYYNSPYLQVHGGARYLATQLNTFDGNIINALAAYNAGPGRVFEYGGVPPFRETQHYVQVIPERYNLYLSRIGGIEALGTIDPALLANANLSLTGHGAAFYGNNSPAAIRQAALRIADIVERISETEDVQESVALNTYARAELVRLVAARIRLQAARTRVLSAEELAQAGARMAEGAFMEFTIREID